MEVPDSTLIRLLGRPTIVGGVAPAPRGRKAWALLAYLLGSERAVSRAHLASLLFADADDPLRSLRWHLAELRRCLGLSADRLGGDPVVVDLRPAWSVDVLVLRAGDTDAALALPGLGHDLLEGLDFPANPAFEAWLVVERRHIRARMASLLREACIACLAASRADEAGRLAARLLALDPDSEDYSSLLKQAMGEDEVRPAGVPGIDPTALRHDAADGADGMRVSAVGAAAVARAQVESARAAVAGGAIERGLALYRRAATGAAAIGATEVEIEALTGFGSALVHVGRGEDREGTLALHRAVGLARDTGRVELAAPAHYELAYVDFLGGRYDRAERWLDRARWSAGTPGQRQASVLALRGACESDLGRYRRAEPLLKQATDLAWRDGDLYRVAWVVTFVGRNHLLCGELEAAATALDRALDITETERLIDFVPWPESLRAEVDALAGDLDAAERRSQHAFALGCELDNPCWESIAGRSIALTRAARGDPVGAVAILDDARRRWSRQPGTYVWVLGYLLEARCGLLTGFDPAEAATTADELERVAARSGMRELLLRAYLHRARLGVPSAGQVAQTLAGDVDNPSLSPERLAQRLVS